MGLRVCFKSCALPEAGLAALPSAPTCRHNHMHVHAGQIFYEILQIFKVLFYPGSLGADHFCDEAPSDWTLAS